MAKSIALIYGFAEGSWHGKRMRRALATRRYRLVQEPRQADVVITHSGGAFEVPELLSTQLLVLINPPYWPSKTKIERAKAKVWQDFANVVHGPERFFQVRKVCMYTFYFIRNYPRMAKIIRDADGFNLEIEIKHRNTVLVRNNVDQWLTPHLETLQQLNPRLRICHFDGDHDECWRNPTPYINLIQSEVKELV